MPNIPKLLAGAFIMEQLIGEGLATLEAVTDSSEWFNG
jgi:hypothetical protein